MQEIREKSKLFKAGNSFGLRITKKDKERIGAKTGDEFEKIISPDGSSITFKKKEDISLDMQERINRLFDENKDLMDRLKEK